MTPKVETKQSIRSNSFSNNLYKNELNKIKKTYIKFKTDLSIELFGDKNDYPFFENKSLNKENVYQLVDKAHSYIEGYHHLVNYFQEKSNKQNIMRLCKAIVQFRPSFIAIIKNLTQQDLVFIEKCTQRTILVFYL